MQRFGTLFCGCERLLTPGGGRTIAQAANLPEGDEIDDRGDEGDEHHRDADGVDVKALGQSESRRSENHRANSYQETDAVEGDEGTADALDEGEEEAGPVEKAEANVGRGRSFG